MSPPPSHELTTVLDVLAEPRRRYLLSVLLEREQGPAADSSPASERRSIETLATAVATIEHGSSVVTDEQVDRVRLGLVHAHIPRLVDAGIVTQHAESDTTTVAITDHPLLEADWVQSLLADPTSEAGPVDEATVNRTLEALRSPRRRTVCAVLARQRGAVSVADLAAMVVACEGGEGTRLVDVTESAYVTVATSLVHEHLPILLAAGLLEYDATAKQVAPATDAPQWQADWVTDGPLASVAEFLHPESRRDGTGAGDHGSNGTETDATTTTGHPVDESAADESPATETATGTTTMTDARLCWTLAQPPTR